MSDLIDRQAVIDALHTWFRDGFEEDKWWNSTHVLAAIEGVPPALREQHHDEWCDSCKEYDKEKHCCPRWNRVIRQTLQDAQPEQHIDADGTLWITVPDIERVKRVIVDEEKSKFCRQFYMDAQPQQTGRWIPQDHNKRVGNISTCVYYYPTCSECGQVGNETYKYCPHCGAKMTEGDAE